MSEKTRAPSWLVLCWVVLSILAWGGVGYTLLATSMGEDRFATGVFFLAVAIWSTMLTHAILTRPNDISWSAVRWGVAFLAWAVCVYCSFRFRRADTAEYWGVLSIGFAVAALAASVYAMLRTAKRARSSDALSCRICGKTLTRGGHGCGVCMRVIGDECVTDVSFDGLPVCEQCVDAAQSGSVSPDDVQFLDDESLRATIATRRARLALQLDYDRIREQRQHEEPAEVAGVPTTGPSAKASPPEPVELDETLHALFTQLVDENERARSTGVEQASLDAEVPIALLEALAYHAVYADHGRDEAARSLEDLARQSPNRIVQICGQWLVGFRDDGTFRYLRLIRVLRNLGSEGLDTLLSLLSDAVDPHVRAEAAEFLDGWETVHDPPTWEKRLCTESVRREKIKPALLTACGDRNARVRYRALRTLHESSVATTPAFDCGTVVPALIAALRNDANEGVRAYCAEWLGERGDGRAVGALVDVLRRGGEYFLEKKCVVALRSVPCEDDSQKEEITAVLQQAARSPYPDVKGEAAVSLGLPGGDTYKQEIAEKVAYLSALLDGHGRTYSFLADEDDDRAMWEAVKRGG